MWWTGLVILCFGCNQITSGQPPGKKNQNNPITKPGQCPPEERLDCVGSLPVNPCSGDGMCPGNQKCCSDGCSKVCQDPSPKPGKCPTNINPDAICAQVINPDDCRGDQSCNGTMKCCLQGCRRECQIPVTRKKHQSLTKPGRCQRNEKPRFDCGVALPNDACFGDDMCPGKQKCCSNGCFGVCQDPSDPEEVLKLDPTDSLHEVIAREIIFDSPMLSVNLGQDASFFLDLKKVSIRLPPSASRCCGNGDQNIPESKKMRDLFQALCNVGLNIKSFLGIFKRK